MPRYSDNYRYFLVYCTKGGKRWALYERKDGLTKRIGTAAERYDAEQFRTYQDDTRIFDTAPEENSHQRSA